MQGTPIFRGRDSRDWRQVETIGSAMQTAGIARPFPSQEYGRRTYERYPDPSFLLPIPVAAWIFVHMQPASALPWIGRSEGTPVPKNKAASENDRVVAMRTDLARKIADCARTEGNTFTDVPGLVLYRRSTPTACNSAAYTPSLVVFVQGRKRINVGKTTYVCDGSNFLLTSVDLPVVSQVIAATPKEPLLGLVLKLEMPVVREILSQQEFHLREESADARGMAAGVTTVELLDACSRLVHLLNATQDIPFLSSLIQREISFRLLRSPQGKHLRAIASLGEQSHRTAKAVEWLRMNYTKPLRVEELASLARMGVSTLHHQFRSLTAMSPLQYQKQLRLHVARERMLSGELDAASAAFEVGYESASQFNREYSRFFGQPPMRDVKARRIAGVESTRD
jgi:AraC-like DNA-binding protein